MQVCPPPLNSLRSSKLQKCSYQTIICSQFVLPLSEQQQQNKKMRYLSFILDFKHQSKGTYIILALTNPLLT